MPSVSVETFLKRGRRSVALEEMLAPREGPEGKRGPEGPRGESGMAGRDGRNGKDGARGADGRNGRDGKDGSGFSWRGNWLESERYYVNDVVNYLGSSYIAIKESS